MLQLGRVMGESTGQDWLVSAAIPATVYSVQGQGLYHLPVRAAELFSHPAGLWSLKMLVRGQAV